MNASQLFTAAHKMTRELVNNTDANYRATFGMVLSFLRNNKKNTVMTTTINTQKKGNFNYATVETNGETFNIFTGYFSGVKGVWKQGGGIYNPKLGLFMGNETRQMTETEIEMANYALKNI